MRLTATPALQNFSHADLQAILSGFKPGGRLTLTSGTPVTVSDVASSTDVYYCPYTSNLAPLWTGSEWRPTLFTEQTLALGTVTSGLPYDVFGYFSAGVLAVEKLAWTNTTTRATAVTLQDGRYCKSGDKTRLYLGTIYTTSTTQTADKLGQRFVWNMYNRVPRVLRVFESTDNWTYTTASPRYMNNNSANKVEVIVGIADAKLQLTAYGMGAASNNNYFSVGIGEDATTYSTEQINYQGGGVTTVLTPLAAHLVKYPAVGYHYYSVLETSNGTSTTFYSYFSGVRQGGAEGAIDG